MWNFSQGGSFAMYWAWVPLLWALATAVDDQFDQVCENDDGRPV